MASNLIHRTDFNLKKESSKVIYLFIFILFYSDLTSFSTIFQSYRDGVWM